MPLFGRTCLASLVALAELIIARIRFSSFHVSDLEVMNGRAMQAGRSVPAAAPGDLARAAMVAALVPRIAYRLPWRSDCLIQAMAAQNWLSREGIAANISIGIDKSPEKGFEAHAWLTYGDLAVCGGDLGRYSVLLDGLTQVNEKQP